MYSRQRYPQHGHMGANMMGQGHFGGRQQMMPPFGHSGSMMGFHPQRQLNSARPMMGQPMGRGQGRRNGGGLLSKILGGNKQGKQAAGLRGIAGAGRAVQGGSGGIGSILQTLSNPDGLTGFLNNTQQVLKSVQSFGPMIQQYGPMVKNLPMMWRLYKGFKDLPSEDKSDKKTTEAPILAEEADTTKLDRVKRSKKNHTESVEVVKKQTGTSMPKLYI
ncbi:VrrA/YqfQ family protein [Neobacillus vireti]|uniref:VrrA/YqfQ family protein n=1 Tax=Neobacillus vireti TaxID=220686 RepID=UPI002FFE792F